MAKWVKIAVGAALIAGTLLSGGALSRQVLEPQRCAARNLRTDWRGIDSGGRGECGCDAPHAGGSGPSGPSRRHGADRAGSGLLSRVGSTERQGRNRCFEVRIVAAASVRRGKSLAGIDGEMGQDRGRRSADRRNSAFRRRACSRSRQLPDLGGHRPRAFGYRQSPLEGTAAGD